MKDFEAEIRFAGSKPYYYTNLIIRADTPDELSAKLDGINVDLARKLGERLSTLASAHILGEQLDATKAADVKKPRKAAVEPTVSPGEQLMAESVSVPQAADAPANPTPAAPWARPTAGGTSSPKPDSPSTPPSSVSVDDFWG